MNVWYMFDNHSFERILETDRDGILQHARRLLKEDSCGIFFVRDEFGAELKALQLITEKLHPDNYKYGIPPEKLENWADQILVERSFRALMVG